MQDASQMQISLANPSSNALTYNATYDNLARPSEGPANPYKPTAGNVLKRKNVLTGNAEETNMSEATFKTQHRTFQSLGYTKDPSTNGAFVGNQAAVAKYGGRDVVQLRHTKEESAVLRAKRQKKGDSSIVDGEGAYIGPWAKYTRDDIAYEQAEVAANEELASDEEWVEEGIVPTPLAAPPKEATGYAADMEGAESTEFHGASEFDYQGRTYMHVPQDLDIDLRKEPGSTQNYHPKKAHPRIQISHETYHFFAVYPTILTPTTLFVSRCQNRAMGCPSRSESPSHIFRAQQGHHRYGLPPYRTDVLISFLRPPDEALGYRDRQMHIEIHHRQNTTHATISPRW